ncbi:hypothetical protein CDAR_175131 [Caerostris darwini]|uniref:Uncharacterized protein n=1 Tax=Caerostris darwini TaxID=1538125 RepID=A0AAV4VYV4_9ARAC|nr:hypothetical protein CDAR_175131 [Caerostris darwini]
MCNLCHTGNDGDEQNKSVERNDFPLGKSFLSECFSIIPFIIPFHNGRENMDTVNLRLESKGVKVPTLQLLSLEQGAPMTQNSHTIHHRYGQDFPGQLSPLPQTPEDNENHSSSYRKTAYRCRYLWTAAKSRVLLFVPPTIRFFPT